MKQHKGREYSRPTLNFLLAEVALQQAFESLAMAGFVALAISGTEILFFVPSGRSPAISTFRCGVLLQSTG